MNGQMKIESLHKRLERLRTEKGLTAKKVAQLIEVPESTYREWEYGRTIQGQPYVQLSKIFEISLLELFTGTSPQRADLIEQLSAIERQVRAVRGELRSLS